MLLNSAISTERWAHELRLTSPNNDKFEWLAAGIGNAAILKPRTIGAVFSADF